MKERINWIDWAKALAVCCVVFCHLPQSQDWFYYRFLQANIIIIFFFISGYLKKDHGSDKANWQKYWSSLILPYLIYNAIAYPYWHMKFYMLNGSMPNLFQAMRPIFGALLFEHENAFCEPLNGPLWYLPAILFMHITIDLCRRTKHQHAIMILLCMLSIFLYAGNKYYYFAPNLTPMGILRRLPYYYIGYVMGQKQLFRSTKPSRDFWHQFFVLPLASPGFRSRTIHPAYCSLLSCKHWFSLWSALWLQGAQQLQIDSYHQSFHWYISDYRTPHRTNYSHKLCT